MAQLSHILISVKSTYLRTCQSPVAVKCSGTGTEYCSSPLTIGAPLSARDTVLSASVSCECIIASRSIALSDEAIAEGLPMGRAKREKLKLCKCDQKTDLSWHDFLVMAMTICLR